MSSIPGKAFVLGEYAVLSGSFAILATVGPRFELREGKGSAFHPQSPAGRLLAFAGEPIERFCARYEFRDPLQGEGGFGASTAQFALTYAELARPRGWDLSAWGAWKIYRELMASDPMPPSGADLMAQWSGGVIGLDLARRKLDALGAERLWRDLLVFSAAGQPGRKVATHEHLGRVERAGTFGASLKDALGNQAEQAAENLGDAAAFGRALSAYAETLSKAGLEIEASREDRLALCGLPGVLGAKGTGAMLADGMIVLVQAGSPHRAAILREAQARGLRLVADGLEPQAGWLA